MLIFMVNSERNVSSINTIRQFYHTIWLFRRSINDLTAD